MLATPQEWPQAENERRSANSRWLFSGSGVLVLDGRASGHQGGDKFAEQGFAAAAGVMDELEEGYGQVWCMGSGGGLVLGSLNGLAVTEAGTLDELT